MEKTPRNCIGEVIFDLLSPIKSSKIELKYKDRALIQKGKGVKGGKNPSVD